MVLEEHPRIGEPVHCTGIISCETAELAKITDDVVLGRLTRARLIGPRGAHVEQAWPGLRTEPILVIDRARFDNGLARQAQAAGAEVRTGVRVLDVETAWDGVTLHTETERLSARACVPRVRGVLPTAAPAGAGVARPGDPHGADRARRPAG